MATVAGLVSFTTIDYPGCLAAVVFFKGCPLRCPFCHNPGLQENDGVGEMTWSDALSFLSARKGKLDGVVLSGGEPLMQPDIVEIAQQVKELGFKVGVHTSGVYPDKLRKMAPYIDWVGLDIKAPWDKYDEVCGRPKMSDKVKESLAFLLDQGISFEARTTCDPDCLTPADVLAIAKELKADGVKNYAMQHYRTFDGDKHPPEQSAINQFFTVDALAPIKKEFPNLIIR
ncbi:MAG: anaerobic ribonucleoside-triphosphate reductase activating protein [Alphaproteobacteria bacterium]|nr:anaerobic ribonucleoside-triphosphate reductase activating protein [Alphaproteobacteria bacterium]